MNTSERKALRKKMPWMKRMRPPAVLLLQIAAVFVLLFLMAVSFRNAHLGAQVPHRPAPTEKGDAYLSFVQLPPFVERVAMQSLRTFLSTFRTPATNDISFADFSEPLAPFAFSTPEIECAGSLEVMVPAYKFPEPDLLAGRPSLATPPRRLPPSPSGVTAFMDEELRKSRFVVELPPLDRFSVASGSACFFVEYSKDAEPDIYLLSPVSPDARMLEGVLLKASAGKSCRGRICVQWN
jgi:hypothetical protein